MEGLLEAILLGVVQGIAEFLPISSSGHLVICQALFDRWLVDSGSAGKLELNVALHLGTLLSILVVYRSDVRRALQRFWLCAAIVVATVPAAIAGVLWKDALESAFDSPLTAGGALLVTALMLVIGHRFERDRDALEQVSLVQALSVGLLQAVALVPGISRSGSTIAAGLVVGLRRDAAASFSFLIAIPVIAGAAALTVWDALEQSEPTVSLAPLAAGAATSFLIGIAALRWLLRLVSQRRLHWFAYYCAAVGSATIVWQLAERWNG